MLMIPTIRPILAMSFCFTRFVAKARAFGGVDMGYTMALLEAMATPISTMAVPTMGASLSPMALQTTARIGISRAAVAEFEMKFDRA